MLDQKPDDRPAEPAPGETGSGETGAAHSESMQDAAVGVNSASASSGGGMLGRFRAGMTSTGEGGRRKPLWRRIAVFVLLWGSVATVTAGAVSLISVFTIGWTGPPPTFNMAGKDRKSVV